MNDFSSVQFDRGLKEGLICPRCTWTHRSDSTRLMDLGMYIRHAKTEHHLLPEQLDDFVSEAIYTRRDVVNEPRPLQPYTVNGSLKYLASPSEENNQPPQRPQSQPHPDLYSTNAFTWESENTTAAKSDSTMIERVQVMGQSSEGFRPSEKPQQDWNSNRLGFPLSNSLHLASQEYTTSLQEFSNALTRTGTPLTTKDKNTMQAKRTTRLASLATKNRKCTSTRFLRLEDGQGQMMQKKSSMGTLTQLPVDTKPTSCSNRKMSTPFHGNFEDLFEQPRQERTLTSNSEAKREHTMRQIQTYSQFRAEESNQCSQQIHIRDESPQITEYETSPDAASISTAFASQSSTSISSLQGSLPITLQPGPGWQEVIMTEPQLNDIQYRNFLSVYVPEVKLNGMDYEGFKALFDQTQDKTSYLELARLQTHAQRTGRLQTYGRLNNINPSLSIAAMRENEKRSNEQSYREELASLMAQRALKEQAQEEQKTNPPYDLMMGDNLLADPEPLWLEDYINFDQF